MPDVIANDLRFYVLRMGTGEQTAVFVHGLVMDNISGWWFTAANAAAREASVVCYDLRGHGRSERPPTGYSVADSVADLVALLDALEIFHPVHLIGNSYGGLVALTFARDYPRRTASLVLVEAHVAIEGHGIEEEEAIANVLDLAGYVLDLDALNEWLEDEGRKVVRGTERAKELIRNSTLVEDLRATPPFRRADLAAITCPVLAIYGTESELFDRGPLLQRLLPRVDLRILEGVDHFAVVKATPEVRGLVVEWLVTQREVARATR